MNKNCPILNYLDPLSGKLRILEIGCARGELFEFMNRSHDIEYFGIERDRSLYNLNLAKFNHLTNFKIQRGHVEDRTSWIPFINKELFDVIVIRGTLDKLVSSDAKFVCKYASYFLKPKGLCVATKSAFNFRWVVKDFQLWFGSCTVKYMLPASVLIVAGL